VVVWECSVSPEGNPPQKNAAEKFNISIGLITVRIEASPQVIPDSGLYMLPFSPRKDPTVP
jgi:hypothetical protein